MYEFPALNGESSCLVEGQLHETVSPFCTIVASVLDVAAGECACQLSPRFEGLFDAFSL